MKQPIKIAFVLVVGIFSFVMQYSEPKSNLQDFRTIPDFAEQFIDGKFVDKDNYPKFTAIKEVCERMDADENCLSLRPGYDEKNVSTPIEPYLYVTNEEDMKALSVTYFGNWEKDAIATFGYGFTSNQGYHAPLSAREWNEAIDKIKIVAEIPPFYYFKPEQGSIYFGGYSDYIMKGYFITYTIPLEGVNYRSIQMTTREVGEQQFAYLEVSTYHEGTIALAYVDITEFVDYLEQLLGLNQQLSKQFIHRNPR